MPVKSRKRYSAPALEKGLDILELLSTELDGLNLSQIAGLLGRSVSEIFRMIVVLERRGYIAKRGTSDSYGLTLKLFQQAHKIPAVARLASAAATELKSLSHAIGQSCHVVTYYDGQGHVVAQQDGPSERVLSVRLGAQAPLIDTCSGHILLAFASDHNRPMMVAEIPRSNRKPRQGEVRRLVDRVRNQGYEAMPSAQIQGVRDIGYPVFDHSGEIAAALVVPFMAYLDDSHPVPYEEAGPHIASSASAISQMLGSLRGDFEAPSGATGERQRGAAAK